MPARRGAEYIEGIAGLYDLQWEPERHEKMTYPSPSTGEPVGLSFIQPHSKDELVARGQMMKNWAEATYGMMGRSPDFLNVALAAFAANHDFFSLLDPRFGDNVLRYYEYVRENDLCLTHTLINMRVDCSKDVSQMDDEDVALRRVGENSEGIIVRGARMLATLAPASDEIAVYPYAPLPEGDDVHALVFCLPVGTPGLKFICRDSFDYGDSSIDAPISSSFEEMDCVAIFDDVLVPWERVFSQGSAEHCNGMREGTAFLPHVAQQVAIKSLAKAEFVLGVAQLITETLGSRGLLHVQEKMGELVTYVETIRACVRAAEADAKPGPGLIWYQSWDPLACVRTLFPKWYPHMMELLQLLGSGSFMMTPSEADLSGPMAPLIERYYRGVDVSARDRIRLFRLAWDLVGSAMGSRQELYERFFSGDPTRNLATRYLNYNTGSCVAQARRLLATD